MEEKPKKVHRFVKVLMAEKDHNLMNDLKPSVRKLFDIRLQALAKELVEKIRRGIRI